MQEPEAAVTHSLLALTSNTSEECLRERRVSDARPGPGHEGIGRGRVRVLAVGVGRRPFGKADDAVRRRRGRVGDDDHGRARVGEVDLEGVGPAGVGLGVCAREAPRADVATREGVKIDVSDAVEVVEGGDAGGEGGHVSGLWRLW